MKRFVTTAAMTAASCAMVLGGAGIASASGDHGRHDRGDHYNRHDHRGLYNHRSGANAAGFAAGSPGILSGNNVQVPINIPINICGNSLNLVAALNPAFGNACVNR
ncbi:membrane protein [Streptomyces glebosus]|uniref:Membrane protein n=1 Tax=Streptomyces glebosus TaxID=249580 RepID=A0A640T0Q0_9ACTN|nr:chaplin [Streptomyces glebosus]GFE16744.1 membrane protein [Streptomyces glebosus]GHG81634.1 membrane protein [Streptomyces glebosus]